MDPIWTASPGMDGPLQAMRATRQAACPSAKTERMSVDGIMRDARCAPRTYGEVPMETRADHYITKPLGEIDYLLLVMCKISIGHLALKRPKK